MEGGCAEGRVREAGSRATQPRGRPSSRGSLPRGPGARLILGHRENGERGNLEVLPVRIRPPPSPPP